MNQDEIRRRLELLIVKRGIKQLYISEITGISTSNLSRFKTHRQKLSQKDLFKLDLFLKEKGIN